MVSDMELGVVLCASVMERDHLIKAWDCGMTGNTYLIAGSRQ